MHSPISYSASVLRVGPERPTETVRCSMILLVAALKSLHFLSTLVASYAIAVFEPIQSRTLTPTTPPIHPNVSSPSQRRGRTAVATRICNSAKCILPAWLRGRPREFPRQAVAVGRSVGRRDGRTGGLGGRARSPFREFKSRQFLRRDRRRVLLRLQKKDLGGARGPLPSPSPAYSLTSIATAT